MVRACIVDYSSSLLRTSNVREEESAQSSARVMDVKTRMLAFQGFKCLTTFFEHGHPPNDPSDVRLKTSSCS